LFSSASASTSSAAIDRTCIRFTARELPRFVLGRSDAPPGTRLEGQGSAHHYFDVGLTGFTSSLAADFTGTDNSAYAGAYSVALLYHDVQAAKNGFRDLGRFFTQGNKDFGGGPKKAIPNGRLGEERFAVSSPFGLPTGYHYGWRVKNVVLFFDYRADTVVNIKPPTALRYARTMDRRVRC
jgi:hypothetical protein